MQFTYRQLQHIDEFEQVVALEKAIWDLEPVDAMPAHAMCAITHAGGLILGALDGERIVGFVLAFPARRGDDWLLWSDMAGIHPDYQNQGIGFTIKQNQREWALERGYDHIGWTFDPLQKRNAHFNLRRLGARSHTYLVNFYGEMNDGINAGLASDRLEIAWDLHAERVQHIASGVRPSPIIMDYPDDAFLLRTDKDGDFILREPDGPLHMVEIPDRINALKRANLDRARAWQKALRQAMQSALNQGYVIVDFVIVQERCWYVLQRKG